MKQYDKVYGSQPQRPLEVDTQSSPTTVYVRQNIHRETVDGAEFWVYDETQYTTREYLARQSEEIKLLQEVAAAMMQANQPAVLSQQSGKQAAAEDFATMAHRFLGR